MTDWRNRIISHGVKAASQFTANADNPRVHPQVQREAMKGSLDTLGWIAPVIELKNGDLLDGHERIFQALQQGDETPVPFIVVDLTEDEARLALLTFDFITTLAHFDRELTAQLMQQVNTDNEALQSLIAGMAEQQGIILPDSDAGIAGESGTPPERPKLTDRFIVPPFSVLDARQGYWQERKRQWLSIGIQSELGRGEQLYESGAGAMHDSKEFPTTIDRKKSYEKTSNGKSPARKFAQDLMRGEHVVGGLTWVSGTPRKDETSRKNLAAGRQSSARVYTSAEWVNEHGIQGNAGNQSGTSIFDPVLCELAYRWFCPPAGAILDPFAGGSVRGIVAALLNRRYTGIDLRAEQVAANQAQATEIVKDNSPRWITGDSRYIDSLITEIFDFIFSCPPYFDLEIYSDTAADLSNAGDYAAFLADYRAIIAAACNRLNPNRFACFVVGDIRDKAGMYRNFVSDTIAAFLDAGLHLYNEAILVTAAGSLPIRVGKQFESGRKLGKTHQNVLVFIKGNPKQAVIDCGQVEVYLPDEFESGDEDSEYGERLIVS